MKTNFFGGGHDSPAFILVVVSIIVQCKSDMAELQTYISKFSSHMTKLGNVLQVCTLIFVHHHHHPPPLSRQVGNRVDE